MFQVMFGDDEHTAAEGPYSRVMKTRKWLYLSSAVGIILAQGFYRQAGALALLKVVELPAWWLRAGLMFGLAYLMIQYGALVAQLVSVYSLILRDRLASKRSSQLLEAFERVQTTRATVDRFKEAQHAARSNDRQAIMKNHTAHRVYLSDGLQRAEQQHNEANIQLYRGELGKIEAQIVALAAEMSDVAEIPHQNFLIPKEFRGYDDAAKVAEAAYQELQKKDGFSKPLYGWLETGIDVLRVIPPFMAACWAFHLLWIA